MNGGAPGPVGARPAATRMTLLRTRRHLERIDRAVEVLHRKREALIGELFRIARPATESRRRIQTAADAAYAALLETLALHGSAGVAPLGRPPRRLEVSVDSHRVWGLEVARLTDHPPTRRTLEARATPPGAAGPAAVATADRFEALVDLLLDAAPRELLLQHLGGELARTSRQLGALEHRLAPRLRHQARSIHRSLEEREREEHQRLRHLASRRSHPA